MTNLATNYFSENESIQATSNSKERLLINIQKPIKSVKGNQSKSTANENNNDDASTNISLIRNNVAKEDIIQSWEGVVIGFNEKEFTVRLKDLTNSDNPQEELTLSRNEIDDNEQSLIMEGAMFYWYLGYSQGNNQSKIRISTIRFRRLANWSQSEINDSKKLAKEYANFFNWD